MVTRGQLIIFEGVDGVGKSTLAQKLTDHLVLQGINCQYYSFPGKEAGTLGKLVYELHHDLPKFGVERIQPLSLQTLHVAAHIDEICNHIRPALQQGQTIVLDRYWWSTFVYGKVAGIREKQLQNILRAEIEEWKSFLPTVVFLVNREKSLRSQDETGNNENWERQKRAYHELALRERKDYPVVTIENEGSVQEAMRSLLTTLESLTNSSSLLVDDSPVSATEVQYTQLPLGAVEAEEPKSPMRPYRISSISPAKPTPVFDTYWRFAAERQNVFFRKLQNEAPPWTKDPILAKFKFTNAYRASDRVSQFLIRNVIYSGEQTVKEVFFRTLLFKIFNRIETWQLLQDRLGAVSYSEYSFEAYDAVLTKAMEQNERLFSAAYIMPSGSTSYGYTRKHRNFLKFLEQLMDEDVPQRISEMKRMRNAFECLREYPLMGDFLAYQFITDINYSNITDFSEMEFVVPGPGARDGIQKCFSNLGGLNEADIIRLMVDRQEEEFSRLGLQFRTLWGRPLQLIDCQNLFCEVDKYSRVAHPEINGLSGRTRIKQTYQQIPSPIHYWYPPKWGINDLIEQGR